MADIIPAIIAKNFEEIEKMLHQVESVSNWVQLDIMDGKFVTSETFNEPARVRDLETPANLEAHLMIVDPWFFLDEWLESGIKRVIVHYEAIPSRTLLELMIKKTKIRHIEFAVAFNPETDWQLAGSFIPEIDMVLFLSVQPGFYGKEFLPTIIPKIQAFRKKFPDIRIEVDGGINPGIAKKVVAAGANGLVVGSYVFASDDPVKAIDLLKEEVQ